MFQLLRNWSTVSIGSPLQAHTISNNEFDVVVLAGASNRETSMARRLLPVGRKKAKRLKEQRPQVLRSFSFSCRCSGGKAGTDSKEEVSVICPYDIHPSDILMRQVPVPVA